MADQGEPEIWSGDSSGKDEARPTQTGQLDEPDEDDQTEGDGPAMKCITGSTRF